VPRPNGASPTSLWGILTWELLNRREGEEDNGGVRVRSLDVISSYFNVFATLGKQRWGAADSDPGTGNSNRVWLGTSVCDSNLNSFAVAGLELADLASKGDIPHDRVDTPLSRSPDMLTGGIQPPINAAISRDKVTFGIQGVGALTRGTLTSLGDMYTCEVEMTCEYLSTSRLKCTCI